MHIFACNFLHGHCSKCTDVLFLKTPLHLLVEQVQCSPLPAVFKMQSSKRLQTVHTEVAVLHLQTCTCTLDASPPHELPCRPAGLSVKVFPGGSGSPGVAQCAPCFATSQLQITQPLQKLLLYANKTVSAAEHEKAGVPMAVSVL